MEQLDLNRTKTTSSSSSVDDSSLPPLQISTVVTASTVLLTACGGGGGSSGGSTTTAPVGSAPTNGSSTDVNTGSTDYASAPVVGGAAPQPITREEAARFLIQASLGPTVEEIDRVRKLGYEGWINQQFAMPQSFNRWDWMVGMGYVDPNYRYKGYGFESANWRKLISGPDTLRQRMSLALSEILVVSYNGLNSSWRPFNACAYMDLLDKHAFGNYRTLLQDVSLSCAMGQYLTYRGNRKADPYKGSSPDENYAREIMQLFTIGLVYLNIDGTPVLVNGKPQETYTQEDVTGLARVFTGWDHDNNGDSTWPYYVRQPMVQIAKWHETGEKKFLGLTIPSGTDGVKSLELALNHLFAHPNVAPFISRQLIQRFVCSHPSPAYVARVAKVFNNNGSGVKGDLKAVIKAILLDQEARDPAQITNPRFGKLREPMLRFIAWARAFKATASDGEWNIGSTSSTGTSLGQSPLRSPSVFNFFRPGYVPPNTSIASLGLTAPEFQITNESSVISYINVMQKVMDWGLGGVRGDYLAWRPLADDVPALVKELNTVLAAGQLSTSTVSTIINAVQQISPTKESAFYKRIYAAVFLVMVSPEFIVQK